MMLLPFAGGCGVSCGVGLGGSGCCADKHFQMISFCVKNRTQDMQEEVELAREADQFAAVFPFCPALWAAEDPHTHTHTQTVKKTKVLHILPDMETN